MPLTVLDVHAKDIPGAYVHPLVLCRADQHVVWRGQRAPAHAGQLVSGLCGDGMTFSP